jgi:hypothetical protein
MASANTAPKGQAGSVRAAPLPAGTGVREA